MSHSVRHHLRLEIEVYDQTIRRWIPGYERMLEESADAVAAVSPELVVDLGAGTGSLSQSLLAREEVGTVELLDVDPEMLLQARARLAGHGERVRFRSGSFDEDLPECDAMCASLALHHIPVLEDKQRFFERIFEALRPGGVLVNADANMPADPAEQKPVWRAWADHQMKNGYSEAAAFRHFKEWSDEDTYFPLDAELLALTAAGFDATCRWQEGPISVVVATKPH